MKVSHNNRRRAFQVKRQGKTYLLPYAKVEPVPGSRDRVIRTDVDKELGGEGFVYRLESGCKGTVLWEQVLDYNKDPDYLREAALYKLTLLAQRKLEESRLSKGEVRRRLGTSPSQLIRLLDQTNYKKSIDQMLRLLAVLDCPVEFVESGKEIVQN